LLVDLNNSLVERISCDDLPELLKGIMKDLDPFTPSIEQPEFRATVQANSIAVTACGNKLDPLSRDIA
jgi:hypothetical protein